MHKIILSLIFSFLAQDVAFAQAIPVTDFSFTGNAVAAGDEIILTQDKYWQRGEAQHKQGICAQEYKASFDAYVGQYAANQGGGSGIFFYEIREDNNNWTNTVGFNVQDWARRNTWNSVEIYKFKPGNITESIASSKPTFPLNGGWLHTVWHVNEGTVQVTATSALGVVSAAHLRPYTPGVKVWHQFLGWTGAAHNLHKVRNFKLEIIRPDNCSGTSPLTADEAKTRIAAKCGDGANCALFPSYLACASAVLDDLRSAGNLSSGVYDMLLNGLALKSSYCDGVNQCPNIDEIKKQAYQEGLTAGYAQGNEDGKAAGYAEGFEKGRQAGFLAGLLVDKVAICHRQPQKEPLTLTVARSALPAHLGHADTLGECPK